MLQFIEGEHSLQPYLDKILALNDDQVQYLSEMDHDRLSWFINNCTKFVVALNDDQFAGYIVVLGHDRDYDNDNFRWFSERYDNFLYVDRIVIAPGHQSQGIGKQFYEFLSSFGRDNNYDRITAEINSLPPNDKSIQFHSRIGFDVIGERVINAEHKVAMIKFDL